MMMWVFLWVAEWRCGGLTYLVHTTELEARKLFASSIVCECGVLASKVMGTNFVMMWNSLLWMLAELLYVSRKAFCTRLVRI